MSKVDTVNHVREINTNLPTITIPTDAGDAFELPKLTHRERMRLTAKLLTAITEHPSTARHQVACASAVIRQLREDSEKNLQAEINEVARIVLELQQEGWSFDGSSGEWVDPSGNRHIINTTLPLAISINKTATEQ